MRELINLNGHLAQGDGAIHRRQRTTEFVRFKDDSSRTKTDEASISGKEPVDRPWGNETLDHGSVVVVLERPMRNGKVIELSQSYDPLDHGLRTADGRS